MRAHLILWGALGAATVSACSGSDPTTPLAKPFYPTGLALSPDRDHLVVVSSNFDLAFDSGALFDVDVGAVRAQFVGSDAVIKDAFDADHAIAVPSFGDAPVFAPTGDAVFFTTRGDNQLHDVDFDAGDLSCAGDSCGSSPSSLQLGESDPFHTTFVDTGSVDGDLRGVVTHLASPTAEVFHFRAGSTGADRLGVETDLISLGDVDTITGVRAAARRPAGANNDEQLFVALQHATDGVTDGTLLAVFDVPAVGRGEDVTASGVDVTALVGSLAARSLAVVADGDAGGVAVIAALRGPDALARFRFDDRTGTFALTHVSETCAEPTNLAVVPGNAATGGVERVLVTCQSGEVVEALDPLTLQVSDSARFFGKNPYGIAVDDENGLAYVSFFLDDTVGVYALADADGNPRLTPVGRLGTPIAPREDGRE